MTSIVIDEKNPSTINTGSFSGNPSQVDVVGIWKTSDRAASWRQIGDDCPACASRRSPSRRGRLAFYAATMERRERVTGYS